MEKNFEYLIQQDEEQFKEIFFEQLSSITTDKTILEIIENIRLDIYSKDEKFDKSLYIETQLYSIGGKEYMIDTKNGIVFSGKRADIVEILSHDELKKLKEN